MKSKTKLLALAGILGVAAVGGTFAYFNQTLTAKNVFDTGVYDTELVEKFRPEEGENWEPGTNVNKDVTVKNTGTLPVVVRVKFQEEWVNKTTGQTIYLVDTSNPDQMEKNNSNKSQTPLARNKFENVYQADWEDGDDKPDGRTDGDDSVVFKQIIPEGSEDEWVYNPADGYYYCKRVLKAVTKGEDGEDVVDETKKLLDGLTLCENVDMGSYDILKFYALTEDRPEDGSDDWISFATASNAEGEVSYLSTWEMKEKLKEEGKTLRHMKSYTKLKSDELGGYSNAYYTLTVTAQTVQATNLAVESAFGDLEALEELGCKWTLTDETVVHSPSDAEPEEGTEGGNEQETVPEETTEPTTETEAGSVTDPIA